MVRRCCYNRSMKIVVSNTSRYAYRGVLKHLKNRLGENNIVIAPDRFTASVERGLISSLEIESTFGIEVMSFTRLADRLVGKDIKKCLTPEGSVMLIGKVIADNRDKLEYYGNACMTEGFASELYAALTALRNSGISTQTLKENSDKLTPSLRAKTHDIALIYDGYSAALEGRHSDSSTRLYALAEYIKTNPQSVATTHFYCTDIYEFSAPELEILARLADNAMSLTIGLTSGYDNPNRRIYPDRVIAKLKNICADKVEIERNDERLEPATEAISKGLFSYGYEPVENGGKVELRKSGDRFKEVLALAVDIVGKVREGRRYRDFEIYASDVADYESEIKSVFTRYGIPFFIDKKELLSEQTKVRYILDAIACVRSGFRRREALDFVKNPLFSYILEGGENDVFLFENYILKYNIDRSRFFSEFTLCQDNSLRKGSFKSINKPDKTDIRENDVPEKVRKSLLFALSCFNSAQECNISSFVKAARKFLDGAEEAWRQHVEKLSALSAYYRKCAEQVDSKLDSVLSEIDEVLDYETDLAGFESVFKSMLKTLKIALVPTYLDCVFVGDGDSRFMGLGDVYVIGATNDKLPKQTGGGVVVSPKDEEYFAKLGIEITPNERQKSMTEKYFICDLMKKTHGKLTVSFPETGGGGNLRPSTVVSELRGMLNENGKPIEIKRVDFGNLSELGDGKYDIASKLFATEKSCYAEVLRNAVSGRAPLTENAVYGSAFACMAETDRNKLESLYDEPERIPLPADAYFAESTSVSRLETFFNCPYSHYFNYILSLRKRKDGRAEGTENGTVLHYVLEKFFTDMRDGRISDRGVIRQKAYAYFESAIKENGFEVLLEKADSGRQLLRVKEEGARVCEDLYDISMRSEFKPALLEAKIGEKGIKPMSLTVGDRKIALKGTIDRIDTCDGKFAIIDYKTYKSADLTLKELYYGQKIQLYIYMRAVENSLNAEPAGVFYLPIFAGFTEESTGRYKYKGQATDSLETLARLDSAVVDEPQSAVIPYKVNARGELNPEVHLSKKGFDTLGDYAVRLAAKGAEEIINGYIKPSPLKDACKKCRYAQICAYKDCCERKTSKATAESFVSDTQEAEKDND